MITLTTLTRLVLVDMKPAKRIRMSKANYEHLYKLCVPYADKEKIPSTLNFHGVPVVSDPNMANDIIIKEFEAPI